MASTAPPTTHKQHPQDKMETALSSPPGTATKSAARIASFQEIPWARAGGPGGRTPAYPVSPSSCRANFSCGEPQLGQNSSDALRVAPHRWQSRFIPLEAISGESAAQSSPSVGALLLGLETVGEIQHNQAEMSLGAASVFEQNQVLMMTGS